jgi:eukaryotic-like serine/threonine-protein kinase
VDQEAIGGRWSLGPVVASGGMGTVHRGVDRATGEAVAIKLLYGSEAIDAQRFEREASILAQLSHASIVRYIAHGVTAEGRLYLVMEWIEGMTLLRRAFDPGLTPDEGLAVVRRVAAALSEMHGRGLVHRDIKPDNVLLEGGRGPVTRWARRATWRRSRRGASASSTRASMCSRSGACSTSA